MQTVDPFQAPSKTPHEIKQVKEEPPPPTNAGVAGMEGMGSGGAIGGILGGMGSAPAPVVKAATPKKIAISSGVMTGLKTGGINPTYPPIATRGAYLWYRSAPGDHLQDGYDPESARHQRASDAHAIGPGSSEDLEI